MTRRRRWWTAAPTRRSVQIAFLVLFFALVLALPPRPGAELNHLAEAFFWFDPLVLIATLLAAHTLYFGAVLSLVVIVATLLLGRVFCGWVCPLGTLHAIAGRLLRRRKGRRRQDHWSRWQLSKYYLLAGLLTGAVFGLHWVCVLDPLVWLTRSTATALLPATQWAVEEGSTTIYQADPGVGPVRLTNATEPAYEFLRDQVFAVPNQAFLGGGLILVLLVAMLVLNAYRPRFWCRYLCPLGALLGVFAWRPLLRRKVQEETCNQCDLCGMACHGAAAAAAGQRWKPAECLGCMNCTDTCPRASLRFGLAWPWRSEPAVESVDLSKRALLWSAAGGLAALAAVRISPQGRGKKFNPELIRPPGARAEREFLQRCTSCGLCMKVCPTGGLQPALSQAGLEGVFTPVLVPRIGYCDDTCNLCGQVCPTEAIQPLSVDEKHATKIGLASFDTTRCIPYAYGRDCMVCEEHCPVPDKAIYCLEVEVQDRSGAKRTIKQPHVDPDKCTGCGVCENVCPFKDRPAIRITSANETRHGENQPILPGSGDDPYG